MRNFFISIIVLLLIGVGLSLSLPTFQSPSADFSKKSAYKINQDSLTSPISMGELLLITPTPKGAEFTLNLGLFSQLQAAIEAAESIQSTNVTLIVKAKDNNREWYLVLLGRYQTKAKAKQQQLQIKQSSATLMLRPQRLALPKG